MSRSRRLTAALVFVLMCAGLGSAVLPAQASQQDEVVVKVLSPMAGSVLAGAVTVRVSVTGLPADVAHAAATVIVNGVSGPHATASLAPGQCVATCELELTTADTAAVDGEGFVVPDGPGRVAGQVRWSAGTQVAGDTVSVVLDNHRPLVAFSDAGFADDYFNNTDKLRGGVTLSSASAPVRFGVTLPAGSTAATREVRFWVRPGREWQSIPTTGSGPAFIAVVDTSGMADGTRFFGRAVALDARGVQSVTKDMILTVDRGPAVSAPSLQAVLPNTATRGGFDVAVRAVSGSAYAAPSYSRTWLDGLVVSESCLCDWTFPRDATLKASFGVNHVMSEGQHSVRFEVGDTRGVSTFTEPIPFIADGGPAAAWTAGNGSTSVTGAKVPIAASVTAPLGQTIASWKLFVGGGQPIAQSAPCDADSCPTGATATAAWTAAESGGAGYVNPWGLATRSLELVVTSNTGAERTITSTVTTMDQSRVTASVPPRALAGVPYSIPVTTTRVSDGAQTPQAPVVLQWMPAGTTAWRWVASGRTDDAGRAVFRVTTPGTGAWRVLMNPTVDKHTGGVSATGWTTTLSRTTVTAAQATVRLNAPATARAIVLPYEPGLKAVLQVARAGQPYRNLAQATVSTSGMSAIPYRLGGTGVWYARVVRPATATAAGSVSVVWRVNVVR